ncbi:hypothetical protein [Amycolatopsis thailandensis]|uniref:Uncharacterized protein n=1 Tax=Amycolatopsis thailandensis TaxID=589330 RepID=A0A229RUD2_9PSEU|nr:hypothetical protein [Amycolatopsis thailandensis]OXM50272.1 hypothetical protein CFP71_27965 [Amycolatopsis thailandensis]
MTLAAAVPSSCAVTPQNDGAPRTTPHAEDLPRGLTHPFEARVRTALFLHGYTFTWTLGDTWIAVQEGRVANANRRDVIVTDPLPHIPMQLGRHNVIGKIPAPDGDWDNFPAAAAEKLHAAATNWVSRHGAR